MPEKFSQDILFGGVYGRVYEDNQSNHYTPAGTIDTEHQILLVHYEGVSGISRRSLIFCLNDSRIDELDAEKIRAEASTLS